LPKKNILYIIIKSLQYQNYNKFMK